MLGIELKQNYQYRKSLIIVVSAFLEKATLIKRGFSIQLVKETGVTFSDIRWEVYFVKKRQKPF